MKKSKKNSLKLDKLVISKLNSLKVIKGGNESANCATTLSDFPDWCPTYSNGLEC